MAATADESEPAEEAVTTAESVEAPFSIAAATDELTASTAAGGAVTEPSGDTDTPGAVETGVTEVKLGELIEVEDEPDELLPEFPPALPGLAICASAGSGPTSGSERRSATGTRRDSFIR